MEILAPKLSSKLPAEPVVVAPVKPETEKPSTLVIKGPLGPMPVGPGGDSPFAGGGVAAGAGLLQD